MDANNISSLTLETMKFHITIDQLLQTIKQKIDSLPDNKDFSSLSEQLKKVIVDLEGMNALSSCHTTEFNKIKSTIDDLEELLDYIKKKVDDIPSQNKEILEQLSIIVTLSKLFNEEVNTAKIRLRNEMFCLTDFNEIIILAKRLNEKHERWSGWKGKTAIIIGLIIGFGAIISTFIDFIKTIKSLMQ